MMSVELTLIAVILRDYVKLKRKVYMFRQTIYLENEGIQGDVNIHAKYCSYCQKLPFEFVER